MPRKLTRPVSPPAVVPVDAPPLEYNQCQKAVERLTEYLSDELDAPETEAVQNHLSECKGCFAKFHFEETLLRTIREKVEQVHAPVTLRDTILGLIPAPKI